MSRSLSRRAVLAGACGTCAVVATGCTTYSVGGPVAAPAPTVEAVPSVGAAPTEAQLTIGALVAAADVPVGGGVILAAQDMVVVQPTAGEYRAYSATCTHQGCSVTTIEDGQIICPCHGSAFAVADGAPTAGPADTPLPGRPVALQGDVIVPA